MAVFQTQKIKELETKLKQQLVNIELVVVVASPDESHQQSTPAPVEVEIQLVPLQKKKGYKCLPNSHKTSNQANVPKSIQQEQK